jgi:hypothetical protein
MQRILKYIKELLPLLLNTDFKIFYQTNVSDGLLKSIKRGIEMLPTMRVISFIDFFIYQMKVERLDTDFTVFIYIFVFGLKYPY